MEKWNNIKKKRILWSVKRGWNALHYLLYMWQTTSKTWISTKTDTILSCLSNNSHNNNIHHPSEIAYDNWIKSNFVYSKVLPENRLENQICHSWMESIFFPLSTNLLLYSNLCSIWKDQFVCGAFDKTIHKYEQ